MLFDILIFLEHGIGLTFVCLHCDVQAHNVHVFVFNCSCWVVIWISTSKTRRKRWTSPGFQWYWDQHQTGYRARKGVKDWFVDTKLFAYMLYVTTLILTLYFSGSSGAPIPLTSNFFRIVSRPQWVLYQYHVDFQPPIESRRLRTALLFQHEVLGIARTFDGAILFLPQRLQDKVIWGFKYSMLLLFRWAKHSFLFYLFVEELYLWHNAMYCPLFRRLWCTVRPTMERRLK